MSEQDAAFYFDLASPLAYLAAERILQTMPVATEWQPVLARELLADRRSRRSPIGAESFEAFRCRDDEEIFRLEVERRAAELNLQPLRWPDPFPFESALAMRAATYAKSIGRAVPFALASFRQAFAGGRSLDVADNVLIAAAACEMHPSAVTRGAGLRSVEEQLSIATARAAASGVADVPAIRIGERVFHGERSLEQAAEHARAHTRGSETQARDEDETAALQALGGATNEALPSEADVATGIAADAATRRTP